MHYIISLPTSEATVIIPTFSRRGCTVNFWVCTPYGFCLLLIRDPQALFTAEQSKIISDVDRMQTYVQKGFLSMAFFLRLIFPSALGFAIGFLSNGGAVLSIAYFSNLFFFAAICNIIYSLALLSSNLGVLRPLRFGLGLIIKLIFNGSHEGGKKLTEKYSEMREEMIDALDYWPQGVMGAVFLGFSALLLFWN